MPRRPAPPPPATALDRFLLTPPSPLPNFFQFGRFGNLRSVWVARRPPGFAFIEFEDPRDADAAVAKLDGEERRRRVVMRERTRSEAGVPDFVHAGTPMGEQRGFQRACGAAQVRAAAKERRARCMHSPTAASIFFLNLPLLPSLSGHKGWRVEVSRTAGRNPPPGGAGGDGPRRGGPPGPDSRCYECGGMGHFARKCRSRGGGGDRGGDRGGYGGGGGRDYDRRDRYEDDRYGRSRGRDRSYSPRRRSRSRSRDRRRRSPSRSPPRVGGGGRSRSRLPPRRHHSRSPPRAGDASPPRGRSPPRAASPPRASPPRS